MYTSCLFKLIFLNIKNEYFLQVKPKTNSKHEIKRLCRKKHLTSIINYVFISKIRTNSFLFSSSLEK